MFHDKIYLLEKLKLYKMINKNKNWEEEKDES